MLARAEATMTWAVRAGLLMRISNVNIWFCVEPETPLRSISTPWPMSFSTSMSGTCSTRVSSWLK